ncbi:hypothetical protein L2243_09435, partial [Xanthomonas perforans]|nr:hypothetical protein [Xanthomonas perforans]
MPVVHIVHIIASGCARASPALDRAGAMHGATRIATHPIAGRMTPARLSAAACNPTACIQGRQQLLQLRGLVFRAGHLLLHG